MLKTILMVTIMASDLATVERAWRDEMSYHAVDQGALPPALAASWAAPALGGRPYLIMQPASGEPVSLRFIEEPASRDYQPMKTEGWNAVEILVQDPDGLAEALAGSRRFKVVGPPRYLTDQQNIKAMQVLGPAGELIYFTDVGDPQKSGFGLQPARTWVDRVFIMVVGARALSALRDFYSAALGMPTTAPVPYRIGVLSRAYGLPDETLHKLSIAQLSDRFLIELDEYPAAAQPARPLAGSLPPGIAMVTFEVDEWRPDLPWLAAPGPRAGFPYGGRRAGVLRGAAGEHIELVERRDGD